LTGTQVVGRRATEVIPRLGERYPGLLEVYGRVASTGRPERVEIDTGSSFASRWRDISVYSPAKGFFVAVFNDITERKQQAADRECMMNLLRLADSSCNTRELVRTVTEELQQWSGCEAVGVRLRDGDDFPYYETCGFPPSFVEAEKYLCARDAKQELLRDSHGNPVLECMCGNVVCGRFDPSKPFFTEGGSFWTNSTSKLLQSTSEADRQSRTRNRCHGEGFESVALVPLRCSGQTLGLLQFNDRQPGRFTPELIALLERAATSLAVSLERRRTQDALRASQERYRLISQNTTDVIWLLDIATERLTYMSPSVQRYLGYSSEEAQGMSMRELLTPASNELAVRRLAELLAALAAGDEKARASTHELDQVRKDGSIVPSEVSVTVLSDESGRPHELLGVTRDISDRKKAEENRERLQAQLFQVQKMESIGRLAGGVAHDFNNLLTVINGYCLMALSTLNPSDPLRESLIEIHGAGKRAAGLTQQLLAFSRKQVLQPRVLDLNRVVGDMRPMLARLVGEDVELRVDLCDDRPLICADPNQLEQVIMNLMVNSRDAMPRGGKLWIETAVVAWSEDQAGVDSGSDLCRYVMLAVSDSGQGMDEETRQRIFEPFFAKGTGKGSGLGLPMVHGIVEQSGGFIEVDSEPGHGTTFKIYLPRVTDAVADEGAPEDAQALRGKETVLVVEDHAEVRKYVAGALRAYGYQVIQAANASEALLFCERDAAHIHLVLTDVVMPLVSGRELADQLAKRWPAIKVLFMSGYSDDAIARHGILQPGTELIQKPFGPDQLARKIRKVLGVV
jgi:PAS domain S-box-containing protein